jgi:hypothetical protein
MAVIWITGVAKVGVVVAEGGGVGDTVLVGDSGTDVADGVGNAVAVRLKVALAVGLTGAAVVRSGPPQATSSPSITPVNSERASNLTLGPTTDNNIAPA